MDRTGAGTRINILFQHAGVLRNVSNYPSLVIINNFIIIIIIIVVILKHTKAKMPTRTLQGLRVRHCSPGLNVFLTDRRRGRRPAEPAVELAQSHRSSCNHCYRR